MIILGVDYSVNSPGFVKFVLDEDLNIVDKKYLGVSTVKKHKHETIDGSINHYNKKDFKNNLEQSEWLNQLLINFIKEPELPSYAVFEGYAFAAKGRVFDIAEMTGIAKNELYKMGVKIRIYEPTVIKMFATGNGQATKIMMEESYNKYKDVLNLDKLPSAVDKQTNNPKLDIVDAYFSCYLLLLELRLRRGIIELKNLDEKYIKIFNRCTKSNPENILVRNFIERGVESAN